MLQTLAPRTRWVSTAFAVFALGVFSSCATAPPRAPVEPAELTQWVLFLEEAPDGTLQHSWRRAEQLDLSPYRTLTSTRASSRPIVLAMGQSRDCDQENRDCLRECMSRPLPRGFGHITSGGRGRGGKEVYCNERCTQAYLDCSKLQEARPQEFTSVEGALDWLKRHRQSLLVGSVVVAAGVAFVVVSAGAGAVILVPAVLLAAPVPQSGHALAESSP